MTVPLAARSVIAILGALLVLTTWGSVIGTLIVPRPAGGWLTRWVDRIINSAFRMVTSGIADHKQRDRVLAAQGGRHPAGPAGGLAGDLLCRLFAAAVAVHQHRTRVGVRRGQPRRVRPN